MTLSDTRSDRAQARPGPAPSMPGPGAARHPRRRGRGRLGRGVAQWPLTLAALLLLMVSSTALGPLLRGSGWWWAMALVAGAVLVACAGARALAVPRSVVPIVGLGVLLVTLTLLFGAGTGLAWLLPTPETFGVFGSLIDAGGISIQQQSTPAEAQPGIVFLLAMGAGLLAVLMDMLAITLRWPALAGVPALVPLSVPGVIVEGGADVTALVQSAIAFLVLLRVDVRTRRRAEALNPDVGRDAPRILAPVRRRGPGPLWGSIVVGSIAIVGALVLSTIAPSLSQVTPGGSRVGASLFGAGVSPMIDLGQDLRRPEAGPALHYLSTAPEPPYFTLLTLDQFTDGNWTVRLGEPDPANSVEDIALPAGLTGAVPTTESETSVVIDGVDTGWLPVPSPAMEVDGLSGNWYWDQRTGAIVGSNATTRDQEYKVTTLEIQPTAEQLRASGTTYPADIQEQLALPEAIPALIAQTARDLTATSPSAYDSAVAIQDYLRSSAFTYDTEAPVEDGYDGGGTEVVATFLEVKRGYCVHFASAMAIMARSIGIPARVALGYLPGTRSSNIAEGLGRYNVDSHDLHSWPELYFSGVGWVSFEPTPGRGSVPDFTDPAGAAPDAAVPEQSAPSTAPRANEDDPTQDAGASGQAESTSGPLQTLLVAGLVALLVACLLLVPVVTRRVRRSMRFARIHSGATTDGKTGSGKTGSGKTGKGRTATGRTAAGRTAAGRITDAWAELSDTAADFGVPVRETQTPRELAAAVAARIGGTVQAQAALHRLLNICEQDTFGRPGTGQGIPSPALHDDLKSVIRSLRQASSRKQRIVAALAPVSLWPWVQGWKGERTGRNA